MRKGAVHNIGYFGLSSEPVNSSIAPRINTVVLNNKLRSNNAFGMILSKLS